MLILPLALNPPYYTVYSYSKRNTSMAKKATALTPPTSYELLARRIQKLILAPRAQLERRAVIAREPDEQEDDWSLMLEQLSEEESVALAPQDDGSVCLTWSVPSSE